MQVPTHIFRIQGPLYRIVVEWRASVRRPLSPFLGDTPHVTPMRRPRLWNMATSVSRMWYGSVPDWVWPLPLSSTCECKHRLTTYQLTLLY
jgi:hypothetical protein